MPKTFYTERDIEDLARRGVLSVVVNQDVVLTELAREKAERLGVQLVREHDTPPSAPVRPYIATPSPATAAGAKKPAPPAKADLHQKVRAAVVARLGEEVDHALLDTIIKRVLESVG
jgi:hypothetical protein